MRSLTGRIISAGFLFGATLLFCLNFAGSGATWAQSGDTDQTEPPTTVTAPAGTTSAETPVAETPAEETPALETTPALTPVVETAPAEITPAATTAGAPSM